MTYVIEYLEHHNTVISPKLLRLDENLLKGCFSTLSSNSFDNLNSGKPATPSASLIAHSSTFINENKTLNQSGAVG